MKKLVYVVDDQPSVLQTAVLIVQSIDPDWQVVGFKNPLEVLTALQGNPPDLVLSDQVMPGMVGSNLLEQVRIACPNAIRLIMSGHVALSELSLITSAHQYIAKPFEAGGLQRLVTRTLAAHDRASQDGLLSLVNSLRSLPSLPQVYHSLLAELDDCRGPGAVIARLIAEDPGLSAKVLQLANSPLFGRGSFISNPIDAVLCLGTEIIKAIVVAQTLFKHYAHLAGQEIDVPAVWGHCWEVAQLAQGFCREKRLPAEKGEEAFLAGLLHETGRLILLDNFPGEFHAACETARTAQSPLTPCLVETFKTAPTRLAAYLLELWGMPEEIVSAVSLLERPPQKPAGDFSLVAALYIADQVASRKSPPDPFGVPQWDTAFLEAIGCLDDVAVWEKVLPKP